MKTLLKTKTQRRLFWKTIDRLQANSINRVAALVFAQLQRDKKAVAKSVAGSLPQNADQAATVAIGNQDEEWLSLYKRIYRLNVELFGAKTVAQFQKAAIDLIPQETRDRWGQLSDEYVLHCSWHRSCWTHH